MSFGDGIASACSRVEAKHGPFAAWCTLVGIIGGAVVLGSLGGVYIDWTIGRKFPDQPPCNQPHVCDTFHGFLGYEVRDFWNNDVKKW